MIIDNEQCSQIKSRPSMIHSKIQHSPSLIGGYSLLYDNKIPIDMKYIDYDRNVNHVGSQEIVNFHIYSFGFKPNAVKIKIQIDSDCDPFFTSKFQCDQNVFGMIKNQQKLSFGFQELPTIIIKCLNRIQQANGKLNASLLIYSDGKSKLTLTQSSEFKNIDILSIDLNQENQDKLDDIIKFKYQQLRKKIGISQNRLAQIYDIIKEKNPSLLQQIQKVAK